MIGKTRIDAVHILRHILGKTRKATAEVVPTSTVALTWPVLGGKEDLDNSSGISLLKELCAD